MPRRSAYNPFEERDREIRRLQDELFRARVALIDLMKPEARAVLESYYRVKTTQDWYRWPDDAAEKIVDLCTDVTERTYQGQVYEARARCPLCGEGPQSYYEGRSGFKLPEGLRRHLVGYGRSQECSVFGAARALGRDHYQSMKRQEGTAPNWAAMKKPSDR